MIGNFVAVYDETFQPVFSQAHCMKVVVKEESKAMEHPVEIGASIIDHVINLPTELELYFILNRFFYPQTYQEMKQLWLNRTLLTVQTKTDTYTNQIIYAAPHEETSDFYDTVAIMLKFRQVLFVEAQTEQLDPVSPQNSSTVERGQIQATPTTTAQQTYADKILGPLLPPPLQRRGN